jgi:hypothetical protein
VVAAVAGAALVGGTASAQIPLPVPTSTTTSTTSSPPPPPPSGGGGGSTTTTTSTTAPAGGGVAPPLGGSPPSSTPPPGSTPPPAAPGVPPAEEPPPAAGGDDTATPGLTSGGFPAPLRALMDSVARTPANNTEGLVAALVPLERFGLTPVQQAIVGFGRFPVAGVARYSHDWWFPRFGPGWRLHQGTDIFAAYGTPVRAPVDGRVRVTNGGLGGLSVYVVQPDGTYWYLTHLSGIADGIAEGVNVTTGQVVGFVGQSGNARGTPPHLHFEVHPRGGPAVDPKPVLDTFIADAVAHVPAVIAAYQAASGGQPVAAGAVAVPVPAAPDLAATAPPREALLWASSFGSTGGALQLAEAEALRAAETVDWVAQQAAAEARAQAELRALAFLDPLTPPLLRDALRLSP